MDECLDNINKNKEYWIKRKENNIKLKSGEKVNI